MSNIADLKSEAETIGLKGDAVQQYILERQKELRDERKEQREEARIQEQRQHELEMCRLRATLPAPDIPAQSFDKPKFPVFKEGDDISSFLVLFERLCDMLQIPQESKALRLSCQLTGKALDVYASLAPEVTENYSSFKKALLKAYNKTPEGYRYEFKSTRISNEESYEQFASQLSRKLDFWLEAANVQKSYDSLRSHILIDQLLSVFPSDLRIFVKERSPNTISEVTTLADNWMSARKTISSKPKKSIHLVENGPQAHKGDSEKDPNFKFDLSKVKCFSCQKFGHYKSECEKKSEEKVEYCASHTQDEPYEKKSEEKVEYCTSHRQDEPYVVSGTVNGMRVSKIRRDTGCDRIVVSDKVLPSARITADTKYTELSDYLGRKDSWPNVRTYIDCQLFTGWVDAVRAPLSSCAVLLGNVEGVKDLQNSKDERKSSSNQGPDNVNAVTRSKSSEHLKAVHPLVVPALEPIKIDAETFKSMQQSCESLATIREKANCGKGELQKNGTEIKYENINGLPYRLVKKPHGDEERTLVVPQECRRILLKISHECPLAGHFSHRKTQKKLFTNFFWPGASGHIKAFCQSCDKCQRFTAKKTVKPVPLEKVPIITEPFSRVNIDLVGPIVPTSKAGHKYVLTLIDLATGYPEAVPLKNIETSTIAESLLEIFSRVGIPKEILSDNGAQFKSSLMQELHSLLGVKPIFASVYHPQTCGRVERMHSTMKTCLRKLCAEKPRDWNRYIPSVMFAMREIPSERTGFSPFELLYGRQARGPLAVLRDLWEGGPEAVDREVHEYVVELQEKMKLSAELAAANSEKAIAKYKTYYDMKAQHRQLAVGDEVLLLLPDSKKKLLMAWAGPYKIVEKRNRTNYVINIKGEQKLFHANLLKKYHRRISAQQNITDETSVFECIAQRSILRLEAGGALELDNARVHDVEKESVAIPEIFGGKEDSPSIYEALSGKQNQDIQRLILENKVAFSMLPGLTTAIEHDIELNTTESIRSKNYPVPFNLKNAFNEEVDNLLKMDIIQPSTSSYRNPVILVRKKEPDLTHRLVVDFRAVNSVTRIDAEPACSIDDDLHTLHESKIFSELDLTRAYYQINLKESARPLTAFACERGLMEFKRMPFGLVNACATYIRLMRRVLRNLENVSFYFDNILVHTKTWDDHISTLKKVISRLREFGLTVKPSKCKFGFKNINYFGFNIGEGEIRPQSVKIRDLLETEMPRNKKALRSFLGLVSFYRKFVPNLSELTSGLSDLLRKDVREPLEISPQNEENFRKIIGALSTYPIRRLPAMHKDFAVRSDASSQGVGAVLLQYYDGVPFPVAYASRKLNDAERRYSTIERECLAVIFAISKFRNYLVGRKFILEVDHKPLVYLNKFKTTNDRLMRWALGLQPYHFQIVHIPGTQNLGADLLSRSN